MYVGKILCHLGRNLIQVGVQDSFVGQQSQIGHKHRCAMHIAAAQVERPCDFVQLSDDGGVGTCGIHGFTDAFHFVLGRFASEFQGLNLNGESGKFRSVGPQLRCRLQVCAKRHPGCHSRILQTFGIAFHHAPAVDAHCQVFVVCIFLVNPRYQFFCRCRVSATTDNLEGRICQLLLSCQPIAAVCPNGSTIECDHSSSGRTIEA